MESILFIDVKLFSWFPGLDAIGDVFIIAFFPLTEINPDKQTLQDPRPRVSKLYSTD